MHNKSLLTQAPLKKPLAYSVHVFTAFNGVLGVFAMAAAAEGKITRAFWLLAGAILIDALDGTLARALNVRSRVPDIDGALLDNLVDFISYVAAPAFMLLNMDLVPAGTNKVAAAFIVISSAFQFSSTSAKTDDHFFTGFPSYWPLVLFYLFLLQWPDWFNLVILLTLGCLVFVPIKYIYPSRLEHFATDIRLRRGILLLTILFGIATIILLGIYPQPNIWLLVYALSFMVLYFVLSLCRTLRGRPF